MFFALLENVKKAIKRNTIVIKKKEGEDTICIVYDILIQ